MKFRLYAANIYFNNYYVYNLRFSEKIIHAKNLKNTEDSAKDFVIKTYNYQHGKIKEIVPFFLQYE